MPEINGWWSVGLVHEIKNYRPFRLHLVRIVAVNFLIASQTALMVDVSTTIDSELCDLANARCPQGSFHNRNLSANFTNIFSHKKSHYMASHQWLWLHTFWWQIIQHMKTTHADSRIRTNMCALMTSDKHSLLWSKKLVLMGKWCMSVWGNPPSAGTRHHTEERHPWSSQHPLQECTCWIVHSRYVGTWSSYILYIQYTCNGLLTAWLQSRFSM